MMGMLIVHNKRSPEQSPASHYQEFTDFYKKLSEELRATVINSYEKVKRTSKTMHN